MRILDRFRRWRSDRLCERLVIAAATFMPQEAEHRLGRPLSDDEKRGLHGRFNAYLCADNRVQELVSDRPTRIVHLFLQEAGL